MWVFTCVFLHIFLCSLKAKGGLYAYYVPTYITAHGAPLHPIVRYIIYMQYPQCTSQAHVTKLSAMMPCLHMHQRDTGAEHKASPGVALLSLTGARLRGEESLPTGLPKRQLSLRLAHSLGPQSRGTDPPTYYPSTPTANMGYISLHHELSTMRDEGD